MWGSRRTWVATLLGGSILTGLASCGTTSPTPQPTPTPVPSVAPQPSQLPTTPVPTPTATPTGVPTEKAPTKWTLLKGLGLTDTRTWTVGVTPFEVPVQWRTVPAGGSDLAFVVTTSDDAPQLVSFALLGDTSVVPEVTEQFLQEVGTSIGNTAVGARVTVSLYGPKWGRVTVATTGRDPVTVWVVAGVSTDVVLVTLRPAPSTVTASPLGSEAKGNAVKQVEAVLAQTVRS